MPPVGAGNGLQHLGMNASVVIAGKTADRFHGINKCSRGEVPVHIGHSVGTTMFGGMIMSTVLNLFFTRFYT
jgi:hypothetical protein